MRGVSLNVHPSQSHPIASGYRRMQDQQGREGQQRQRPDHQRGPPPALGDVEPVGEDQDGGQQHDVLHRQLRHHLVVAQRVDEHQPVLDERDPARQHPDHPQLQGLEPGQRDGPTAPEQGDDPHEGQDDHHVDLIERQVLIRRGRRASRRSRCPASGYRSSAARAAAPARPAGARRSGVAPVCGAIAALGVKPPVSSADVSPPGRSAAAPAAGGLRRGGASSPSDPEAGRSVRGASGARLGPPARPGPAGGRPRPAGRRPRRRRRGARPPARPGRCRTAASNSSPICRQRSGVIRLSLRAGRRARPAPVASRAPPSPPRPPAPRRPRRRSSRRSSAGS